MVAQHDRNTFVNRNSNLIYSQLGMNQRTIARHLNVSHHTIAMAIMCLKSNQYFIHKIEKLRLRQRKTIFFKTTAFVNLAIENYVILVRQFDRLNRPRRICIISECLLHLGF